MKIPSNNLWQVSMCK